MKIEGVDLFYLSMPQVRDVGDGSQDALLVRVHGGGLVGWGECETSPLVSIANWVCPMSHSACKPVKEAVLGYDVDCPDDILRLGDLVRADGLDIAQTDHTFSGVEIALWDLLGKHKSQPVYELLGYTRAYPKTPYASQLFGDTPDQTCAKAADCRRQGYRAVKFGWGPFGRGDVEDDRAQLAAAREGLGDGGTLLVDAGTIWHDDIDAARQRLEVLQQHEAVWLEEPFVSGALEAYRQLASECDTVRLAAGEGAHDFFTAQHLIDYGRIGYVQIDTGRIGGIGPAKRVADYAGARGVRYVNHTFTTHLALSASLQPYAGVEEDDMCEYPVEPSALAAKLCGNELEPDSDGLVRLPETPGLGVQPDLETIRRYMVPVEIKVGGREIWRTPKVV